METAGFSISRFASVFSSCFLVKSNSAPTKDEVKTVITMW